MVTLLYPRPHSSAPESALPPPARPLLRDEVYARLEHAIITGQLAPGARLRDAELSEWLRVSRTPIREAMHRLAAAGLVLFEPNRFTIVTEVDPDAVDDTCEALGTIIGGILLRAGRAPLLPALPTDADARALVRHHWSVTATITSRTNNAVLEEMIESIRPSFSRAATIAARVMDPAPYGEAARALAHADTAPRAIAAYNALGAAIAGACREHVTPDTGPASGFPPPAAPRSV